MKKILIALALIFSLQIADAQVKSPSDAKRAVDAAEAAAANPKKAAKVATWTKLAEAYMSAYLAPAGSAWVGASQQDIQLIMANEKPISSESVVISGEQYTKQIYETRNYYFNGAGILSIIEVTAPVIDNPLGKALDAYVKAYSVDAKKSKTDDIAAGIKNVSSKYLEEGMNKYMLGDLNAASINFEKAADAAATEPCSSIDSIALYNAGFTAWMTQNYERAKGFFEKCVEIKYYENGESFAKLADCYAKLEDKEAAKATLENGFTEFPQSQSILIGLINFYIESGDNPERLFTLLDEAKKNEPNNASLYYVEGNIYSELGNREKALASYAKCAEINPEYEYGFIGAGIMLYNEALELQEKAQNELDDEKYMKLVDEFESVLMQAIEPFESAYKVCKNDEVKVNIAEYLKNIYYRFRDKDAKYDESYKIYDEVVKTGVVK